MTKFNIPKENIEGFKILNELSNQERNTLFSQLESIPEVLLSSKMHARLYEKTRISTEKIDVIIRMLQSLIITSTVYETDNFIGDITANLKELNVNISKSTKDFLLKAIQSEILTLHIKASQLSNATKNIYIDSKIISDIRPVFTNDDASEFKAAIILHTLNLIFRDRSEIKEINIALDSDELEELKKTIIRAESKEKVLKELLNKKKIKNIAIC